MATTINLPSAFDASKWTKGASTVKAPAAKSPMASVKASLDKVQKGHEGLKAIRVDVSKLKTAAEIQSHRKAVQDEQDAFKEIGKGVADAGKGAAEFLKLAGKDIDKTVQKQAQEIQAQAKAYLDQGNAAYKGVLDTLEAMLAKATQPVAKAGAGAGAGVANKSDAQLLMKLSKKAVAFAMKPKPNVKPMQFAIIGKKGTPIKVLMGTKTEVAKLIGKFWKPDPATKKKPVLAKDPMSEVRFENGALVFVSAKISSGYLGSMKKALVVQIKKSPKVKWRKPGHADEDASGGGDDLKAEDVHVEEEAADAAADARAKAGFEKRWSKVKTDPRLKTRTPADRAEVDELVADAEKARGRGEFVDALDILDAIDAMLDNAPVEDDDEESGAAAKTAGSSPAAKSPGVAPAAKTASAGNGAVARLFDDWNKTRSTAIAEVESLKKEIEKLYPKGDAGVKAALVQLDGAVNKLKGGLDTALKGLATTKNDKDLGKLSTFARQQVDSMLNHVNTDEIMKNLDNNEVKVIGAHARLKAGLEQIKATLSN